LLIPRTMLACEASATVEQARDADPMFLWAFVPSIGPPADLSAPLWAALRVRTCVLGRGGFARRRCTKIVLAYSRWYYGMILGILHLLKYELQNVTRALGRLRALPGLACQATRTRQERKKKKIPEPPNLQRGCCTT
jgi:hypothetical protein